MSWLAMWAEWIYQGGALWEMVAQNRCPTSQNGSVVVYAPGHLGDFLQLTPMLKGLRIWAAHRRVVWLVGAWTMDLARRYGDWVDDIREFSPQQETLIRGNAPWKRSAVRQWMALRNLRRQGIAVLVSTMPEDPVARFVANTLRPHLWVGIGDRRPPRVRADIRVVMVPFDKERPEADAQLELLEIVRRETHETGGMGVGFDRAPMFPVTEAEREWAGRFLETEGIGRRPFAIMSPGSGWSGKNWSAERFAELASRLKTQGVEVAWTGSLGERNLCMGPGCNWMGKLTLGQLAALMERATVWIGNDSGTMHLAVAVECRTVSFWGPTNENKWGGSGKKHTLLRGKTTCPGCIYWDWRRKCPEPGHPCMSAISVDEAERAVVAAIGQGKARDG